MNYEEARKVMCDDPKVIVVSSRIGVDEFLNSEDGSNITFNSSNGNLLNWTPSISDITFGEWFVQQGTS